MRRFKIFVLAVLFIITGGVVTLWLYQNRIIKSLKTSQKVSQKTQKPEVLTNQSAAEGVEPEVTGSAFSLLEETAESLQASLSSLMARVEELEQEAGEAAGATGGVPTPVVFQPQTIFLGSNSSNKRDWTNSGIEVILNSADYPADVTAVFEAGLSIAGGEAWARLKNKTTGAIISITEVFHNTSTITWKTSPSFKLHPGSYTYVVQLRSTSGETANLSGARLKISR